MTNKDYQIIFHEIKNNITFINSSLQLVEKKHPKVKEYSYWNDAMQEVNSLKKMLIDLSSARLTDDLTLQRTAPEDFLSDFMNSCMTIFDQSSFCCEITCDSPLPDIQTDGTRLKRALLNLMKNSYESMNAKGIVKLHAYQEDAFVRLDLTDFGGGISPDYLPKLFTPFETTKANGTGLGLLITKQIIEAHGGQLTVDSRPGDGCTFSILLPCAP